MTQIIVEENANADAAGVDQITVSCQSQLVDNLDDGSSLSQFYF